MKTQVVEKKASWFWFVVFLVSIVLACCGFKTITYFWKYLELSVSTIDQRYSFHQLLILPLFVMEYIVVGLVFICFLAWRKKGFSNLKSPKQNGLIEWIFWGLFGGLFGGFIVALSIGILIKGVAGGLIVGLFIGVVVGFIKESFC